MERCKTLINKLVEQSETNADPSAMMVTVQLIQAELSNLINSSNKKPAGYGKVAVVLPAFNAVKDNNTTVSNKTASNNNTETNNPAPVNNNIVAVPAAAMAPEPEVEVKEMQEERAENGKQENAAGSAPDPNPLYDAWTLDPVLETPTLAHQDEIKELNQKIGQQGGKSLNERLKTSRTEIASLLTEAPVRDLKKAIGVNDRFLFLNELFRGDVDMYERSIKTINNFRILAEAEYWMERELKIKLGWDDRSETVKQFTQLVRRRFS